MCQKYKMLLAPPSSKILIPPQYSIQNMSFTSQTLFSSKNIMYKFIIKNFYQTIGSGFNHHL